MAISLIRPAPDFEYHNRHPQFLASKDPGSFISFGLLSSIEKEPLARFNYFAIEKQDVKDWHEKEEFIEIAGKFIQDGKWEGYSNYNHLQSVINRLDGN